MNTDALRGLIKGFDLQTDLWWLATLLSGLMATLSFPIGAEPAPNDPMRIPSLSW